MKQRDILFCPKQFSVQMTVMLHSGSAHSPAAEVLLMVSRSCPELPAAVEAALLSVPAAAESSVFAAPVLSAPAAAVVPVPVLPALAEPVLPVPAAPVLSSFAAPELSAALLSEAEVSWTVWAGGT